MSAPAGRVVTLHPGQVALGFRGDILETLLGSCVAILLTDPRRTVGVMSHIVHSRPAPAGMETSCAYADVALKTMVNLLQAQAIAAHLCDAYVYGGGNLFPDLVPGRSVGDNNAQWALDALARLGAHLVAVDLGGPCGRQLTWTIGTTPPLLKAIPA